MFIRGLLVRKQLTRLSSSFKQTRCSSQAVVKPKYTDGTSELRLTANKPKKPNREPFAKNIFLGTFDVEFLAFPEPQSPDRHRDFFKWLKPIEDYINETVNAGDIDEKGTISAEIFEELRNLGVLRAAVDEDHGGLGLNHSEYAKLVETLSAVPVIGMYFAKQYKIINFIKKYATEEQKRDILPKIANGEITPTLCFSENPTGSVSHRLEGKALLSDCLNFFCLNASKVGVFNAIRANLFLVIVPSSTGDVLVEEENLCGFFVPSDSKGIKITERRNTLGQKGVDICDVTFENVEVPKGNLLGKESCSETFFEDAVGDGKHNVGAQTIGLLKCFLNSLITRVRESKDFNTTRNQEDSAHDVVAKIAADLYAMEAVTYLTAGMMDNFENQDAIMESALVEMYCTRKCVESMMSGMKLLGLLGYQEDQPFPRLLRDFLALGVLDRSTIDSQVYASMLGLRHAGNTMAKAIQQHRNPLFHPYQMLKFTLTFAKIGSFDVHEHLHPSLQVPAESLECSLHKFRKCVKTCFVRYGVEILTKRMELRRLSDMMVEIYAMTAVIARASRSYCIGLRNAEDEIRAAMLFCYHTFERVQLVAKELEEGDYVNGDTVLRDLGDSMFQQKKYFASHPMERNF